VAATVYLYSLYNRYRIECKLTSTSMNESHRYVKHIYHKRYIYEW